MENTPILSVCIPNYNAGKYLRECIDSILSQSFTNFELLIVDDGSTDESVSIIQSYADSRIRLLKNNHNYIASLNLLLHQAKGKYIVRMDADDKMLPDRLLIQYNYMEYHPDIDVLGGGMEFFGDREGLYIPEANNQPITMEEMLEVNMLAHPTVMIRKSSLAKIPVYYEDDYIYAEDYKFWITMLQHGLRLDNIPTLLLQYRVSAGQNSNKYRLQQQQTVQKIKEEYATVNHHHSLS